MSKLISERFDEENATSEANIVSLNVDKPGIARDDTPARPALELPPGCALCASRKGILKKVRFDEACGPMEEERVQEQIVPVHSSSPARSAAHTMAQDMYHESPPKSKNSSLSPLVLPSPRPPPPPPPPPPPTYAPRPPTLFNKAIEGNEYLNAAALRLYTSFIDELAEFVTQQDEVVGMRLAVQERRKELHRLREHVSRCDMMLFNCVREQINGSFPSDKHVMLDLFEASQAARDEIGPVESEYEPLEIMLGSKEHQLIENYAKIEKNFDHFFKLKTASTKKPKEPSEIEYEASSVGTVDDQKNEFENTEHLHGALIGDNVGIGQLPRHAKQLKPGSPERWEPGGSHRRTVSMGSTDMPRPRSNGFAEERISLSHSKGTLDFIGIWITDMMSSAGTGVMLQEPSDDESAFPRRSNSIEVPDALPDFMDNYPVNPGLEEGIPLLLLGESNDTRGILSDYLVNFDNTPDRVNRWILHQLRISPREIYKLHRSIAEQTGRPFHGASSVLKAWPHDRLGYDNTYDEGSVELEESIQNPQALGYHGACPPGCRDTHNWPTNDDVWLAPWSSTFSTAEYTPNFSTQPQPEPVKLKPHELSSGLYDDD
jgi:hypothetical protein